MSWETEKNERILEYAKELEEIKNFLKRETRVRELLQENVESTNKYLESQRDVYENPEQYYNFRSFDKLIYISKSKRMYFKNLENFSSIKTWRYNIVVQGISLDKNIIRFDGETKKYGCYETLEETVKVFKKVIYELLISEEEIQSDMFTSQKLITERKRGYLY